MSPMMMFPLLMLLVGGEAGDLLDYTPTESYWQMRDQRIVDTPTMSAVLTDDDATPTDRLMAIRALGELGKVQDADKAAIVKLLTPLVDSKEPFVGQYTRRSLAWVKGQDPAQRVGVTAEQLAADLALLPNSSTVVGQLRIANGVGPVDLTTLIPEFKAERGPSREQMTQQVQAGVMQIVGLIGNARMDAASFGFTFLDPDGNDDDGYAVIIARGQYDRVGVQMAMEDMAQQQGIELNLFSIGEIEVVMHKERFESFAMMMPSNELFIFMVGGGRGDIPFPLDKTAELLKNGGAEPGFNAAVTEQLKQIERDKADAWLALEVPMGLRQDAQEIFGPFTAGHAVAVRGAGGEIDVSWTVDGDDAGRVAAAVKVMNENIAEGRAEIARDMERMPQMKPMFEPMAKMLESMKIEPNGKTMTGGMKLPSGVGMMMPMYMMGGVRLQQQENHAREIQAAEAVEAVD